MTQSITDAKDVTDTTGEKMRSILKGNKLVKNLCFPSMKHPKRKSWNYSPSDFESAGQHIGQGDGQVKVYSSQQVNNSSYWNVSKEKGNDKSQPTELFVFKKKAADSICSNIDVVVHETTHMIQDMKGFKMSAFDMEMDAHFGQALYLVRAKQTQSISGLQLIPFLSAAEEYDNDPDYVRSRAFRKQRGNMSRAIIDAYARSRPDFFDRKKTDGLH